MTEEALSLQEAVMLAVACTIEDCLEVWDSSPSSVDLAAKLENRYFLARVGEGQYICTEGGVAALNRAMGFEAFGLPGEDE